MHRLSILALSLLVSAGLSAGCAEPHAASDVVEVFKTPTCGCCGKWVDHMKAAGFTVKVTDLPELSQVKAKHGVPAPLQSCHTSLVGGYVVEGHIPAADVKKLLAEKPKVHGIAVPGMPVGSPGMEVPGGQRQPYSVLTFDKAGKTAVFVEHR